MKTMRYSVLISWLWFYGLVMGSEASFQFLKTLADDKGWAVSPLDMELACALLYQGAAGVTREEFSRALFQQKTPAQMGERVAELKHDVPGYRRTSSIWFDPAVHVTPTFQQHAQERFRFPVLRYPLGENSADATREINAWFGVQTHGVFHQVITPPDIQPQTEMVFIIASAFKSPWERNVFSTADTIRERFYTGPGNHFPVRMMCSTMNFAYASDEGLHAVVIDYAFKPFSLMIVMPKLPADSNTFPRWVTPQRVHALLDNTKFRLVQLWLPKVKIVSDTDYTSRLAQMGIPSATQIGHADFSGINDGRPNPLYLTKLKQSVIVSWDEKGTIARSITFGGLDPFGSPPKPPVPLPFIANRPFQFFIFDRDSRDIYFAGLVREAEQMLLE